MLISRDPRSYAGSTSREPGEPDPNGATNIAGVYVIDAANPADLQLRSFEQLPTGHTTTCINDCQWLWTGGPAATTTQRQAPLNWVGGRPIIVTDLSDQANPVGHPMNPVDLFRRDGVGLLARRVESTTWASRGSPATAARAATGPGHAPRPAHGAGAPRRRHWTRSRTRAAASPSAGR